ncbi:MAG: hypothetical protein R3A52_10890 [Polyangiales bacterium]
MSRVRLERAEPSQRDALANLAQLYIHDFNAFLAPGRTIALGDDGRYPDALGLDRYWAAPDRAVWFIRVEGALAGFALLNAVSHCGRPVDHNLGEFFVARGHRRDGVGLHAAVALIHGHPGRWEVAVSARNPPAQSFWARVVEASGATEVEALEGDGAQWTGPIWRFVSA